MSEPFDPTVYTRAPILSVSSGVSLAMALVSATPKDADKGVKKAQKNLKAVADKARGDMTERNKQLGVFTDEDSRVLDNEADRAWGAFRQRLVAYTTIPEHAAADAKRAAELDYALFQGSMEFLKAEYAVQSTRMSAVLQQIDDQKLQHDLDRLAGAVFVRAIRDVQPRYEVMVQERLRRDKATGQNLGDTVRALQAAIVSYATKVCGAVEHDEPETAETARVALLPILNHRETHAKAGAAPQPPPPPPAPPAS
ncbi:MAG TPA: hypothetical protein VGM56_26450 [Byssovorax sp.]|jgi:hypothetical protein